VLTAFSSIYLVKDEEDMRQSYCGLCELKYDLSKTFLPI
jgi:hypothetical protein